MNYREDSNITLLLRTCWRCLQIGGSLAGLLYTVLCVYIWGTRFASLSGVWWMTRGVFFFLRIWRVLSTIQFQLPWSAASQPRRKRVWEVRILINLSSWSALCHRLRWSLNGLLDPGNPTSRSTRKGEGRAVFELGKIVANVMKVDSTQRITTFRDSHLVFGCQAQCRNTISRLYVWKQYKMADRISDALLNI